MSTFLVQTVESMQVVELPARVDSDSSLDLDKTLKELVGSETRIILCDFSQNTYISSLGLRVLLGTLKTLKKNGGTLVVCSLSPFVQEVFDISGFSRIFSIYQTESEAVADLVHNRSEGSPSPQEQAQ